MNLLFSLLTSCLKAKECPESFLDLELSLPLPKDPNYTLKQKKKLYEMASSERFPQVLDLLISLTGVRGAKVAATLTKSILEPQTADAFDMNAAHPFISVYEVGISLSWWLFGLGVPIRIRPTLEEWNESSDMADYIRTLRYKQGWSDLESRWLVTQTHEGSQKLTHRVLCRVMAGLPKISIFPEMPDILMVYRRLIEAVRSFVVPEDCEDWLAESISLLQASPWRVCALLLVRQGSISHWNVVGQQPRRKSERLAFVLSLLLDLYGVQEGLEFYMRVLNEEAMEIGFQDLSEVIRGAVWNINLNRKNQD